MEGGTAVANWALSPLDISFLTVESAAIPMTIGAVAVLAAEPEGATDRWPLIELLRTRATEIPRLRRKLRSELFPPVSASWAEDRAFRADAHVRLHHTVGGGGSEELNSWIARIMSQRLDRSRPLWELHVLDGLADGRAAMLLKVHHAFLDGLGVGALAYALADGGSPDKVPAPAGTNGTANGSAGGNGHHGLPRFDPGKLLGPLAGLADPPALARTAARALSTATGVITHMSTAGPGFPFDTVVSPARGFATSSVALEDLRGLRTLCGGSVNDIGIGVLSGALRSWLELHHYRPDDTRLRALVPVGRARSGNDGSGNHFSAFLLHLPVHLADPIERLRFVAGEMARHRAAGAEGGAGALAGLTNLMPAAAVRLGGPMLAGAASKLFDMLVTTVPVPRPLAIGGCAVNEIYALTPLGPNQPLAIGCSSYAGRMHYGFTVDPIVVPNPEQLAAAIPAQLAVVRTIAGLRAPAVKVPAPR
ncbi:wax ester/triacylglycerol synthase family O-acyltransferase [Sporichthya sp.]|uniref:wax ester/triacylglycerol synthase family O-acyltransferase n=1 Tax=Sporichthya sp. TaxID=65475 RepID=UPI001843D81C|nr:wax ester/triacylglycerol synthase family O-acyltransferase [Sporichthya sp.]MBA3741908.1 wax ester/triacylglycerol synthase family O-acyltransferase [Sporichthya sp.]